MNVELAADSSILALVGIYLLRVEDAIAPSVVCLWQTQRDHNHCGLALRDLLSGLLLVLCASQSPFLQLRGDC